MNIGYRLLRLLDKYHLMLGLLMVVPPMEVPLMEVPLMEVRLWWVHLMEVMEAMEVLWEDL